MSSPFRRRVFALLNVFDTPELAPTARFFTETIVADTWHVYGPFGGDGGGDDVAAVPTLAQLRAANVSACLVPGSAHSANDDGKYAWIADLKQLVREIYDYNIEEDRIAKNDDIRLIGICFGVIFFFFTFEKSNFHF